MWHEVGEETPRIWPYQRGDLPLQRVCMAVSICRNDSWEGGYWLKIWPHYLAVWNHYPSSCTTSRRLIPLVLHTAWGSSIRICEIAGPQERWAVCAVRVRYDWCSRIWRVLRFYGGSVWVWIDKNYPVEYVCMYVCMYFFFFVLFFFGLLGFLFLGLVDCFFFFFLFFFGGFFFYSSPLRASMYL